MYASVLIRNGSGKPCLLEGVPKVKLLDETGKAVPVTVSGNEDLDKYGKGSKRFVLHPGGKAGLTVVTEGTNFDQNRCGRNLVLDIHGVIVAFEMLACGPPRQPLRIFLLVSIQHLKTTQHLNRSDLGSRIVVKSRSKSGIELPRLSQAV